MSTAIAIIIIFGLIISIHEFGHLVMAKRAGILCHEFAIGFGPKIYAFRKNETKYTIRLLPIGGYVRMAGEEPETIEVKPGHRVGLVFNADDQVSQLVINNKSKHPEARVISVEEADLEKNLYIKGYDSEDGPLETFQIYPKADFIVDEQHVQIAPLNRQFSGASLGRRILAIFAGPFMNFFLAFVLFCILAAIQGIPVTDAQIGSIVDDSPAAQSSLQKVMKSSALRVNMSLHGKR